MSTIERSAPQLVNDIHSRLNPTLVAGVVTPRSINELQAVVRRAAADGTPLSVAGGRHAMGGQQFGRDGLLVDTSGMNRVLAFDPERRTIDVQAGMRWTELLAWLAEAQRGSADQISIVQKQTGADELSIGGALSANIHGRGLRLKPFVADIESFVLVDAAGAARACTRAENAEMIRLAIGGYGLFGAVASVRLRLTARRKLRRVVRVTNLDDFAANFIERDAGEFAYGDFQFMTDESSDGFLDRGVLSAYQPVADQTPLPAQQRELSSDDWRRLILLAHTDRAEAFRLYARHYLATHDQIYFSDTHQLGVYLDGYHAEIDRLTGARCPGSEMITEVYIPRPALRSFMQTCRENFRRHKVELIYGTIRLIEPDDETFLAWAKDAYACIVFNLHVAHDAAGLARARTDFRRVINRAVEHGGSFYLTYHAWATREQLLACYPQFVEFLRLKRCYDRAELFQSDWYRRHKEMFADDLWI